MENPNDALTRIRASDTSGILFFWTAWRRAAETATTGSSSLRHAAPDVPKKRYKRMARPLPMKSMAMISIAGGKTWSLKRIDSDRSGGDAPKNKPTKND